MLNTTKLIDNIKSLEFKNCLEMGLFALSLKLLFFNVLFTIPLVVFLVAYFLDRHFQEHTIDHRNSTRLSTLESELSEVKKLQQQMNLAKNITTRNF